MMTQMYEMTARDLNDATYIPCEPVQQPYRKSPLNNKQRKGRTRSKMARQSRKNNR